MSPVRADTTLAVLLAVSLAACAPDGPPAGPDAGFAQAAALSRPLLRVGNGNECKPPKVRPSGKIVENVTTSPAWGVAVRDDGLVFFTVPFEAGVGITSTQTRTVDGFIPTGAIPTGIAFSPDGQRAYVANQGSNSVSVIDADARQEVAVVSTEDASPFVVQVSPDNATLFVGTNSGRLVVINTQTLAVTNTTELGNAVNGFAVHPDGRMVYASSFTGGTVTEVDILTSTALRTFVVGGSPQDMAVNRKGTVLYVANEAGYMTEIDIATGNIGTSIPLGGGAFGVGVTPDDREAYVSIPSAGKVQVFNLQQGTLRGTMEVGGEPRRISFSEEGRIGAVANMAGRVTLVR
jgi:YVTN family beta-propeller protein